MELNREMLRKHLALIPFLHELDQQVLTELAHTAIWQEYAPGAIVLLEGEAASALYYVHFGWMKALRTSADGREQILRLIGPGEIFNEVGVFANLPNPATVMALEAAGAWLLPRAGLRHLLKSNTEVAAQVVENMAKRILYLVDLVADLSLQSVEERLAHLLLTEAKAGLVQRQRWATQAELAARLGTVPDVISRVLRSFSDAGVIQVNRHEIRILDQPALEKLAQI